ncbi:MAG: HDOD domain-containing protein [Spirochaetia bacterium]|nr:HDOD domain-containing protein [Spirochaetia bacterium]
MGAIRPGEENQLSIPSILEGSELAFRYSGLMNSRFNFVSGFLHRLLCEVDLSFRCELVLTILKEIVTNCSKAHAKRIYFKEKGLSVGNPDDYKRGILDFHQDVLANWDSFTTRHDNNEYYIQMIFELDGDALIIHVENNAEILATEWERIKARRARASSFRDMLEAFSAFQDDSEGAGLGLVFICLLLRSAGIADDTFTIQSENGITRHSLRIPRTTGVRRYAIKDRILNEIDGLPSIPERVTRIITLCTDSSASIATIARAIEKDPALTAQVLRLVHSAGFMSRRKHLDLESAITLVGLAEVSSLVLATASRSVLTDHYQLQEMTDIWDASHRISYFSGKLAESVHLNRVDAILAGLLSELGKIVLAGMKQNSSSEIWKMLGAGRVRNSTLLEESEVGIAHPEIGALLGEKWNFPEEITAAIRYQHKPLLAPEACSGLVRAVYIAGRLQESISGIVDYYSVEPDVLEVFRIKSAEEFTQKAAEFSAAYNASQAI